MTDEEAAAKVLALMTELSEDGWKIIGHWTGNVWIDRDDTSIALGTSDEGPWTPDDWNSHT